MRRPTKIVALSLLAACRFSCAAAGLVVIPTSEECRPWEKTAGDELAFYLARLVKGDAVSVDGARPVRFHVGDTEYARAHGLASDSLSDEEWIVKSFGEDVVLNGGGTRGALYAVYHFLEDCCGVRFWSETAEDVPVCDRLELGTLDLRGRPAYFYRDIYTTHNSERASPRIAARRRLNRFGDVPIPAEFGGALDYGPPYHCHTFNRYISWEELGSKRPELFALVDGKRCGAQQNAMNGQLCLSNPEVYSILRERLMSNVVSSAESAARRGAPAPRMFEVSMNDNHRYCQCDGCKAEIAKYGVTGQYLNFVNKLAEDVKAIRPDVLISTLAYYFTETPPSNGVRACDNVVVKLCNTRQNMAASILADGDNRIMRNLLDEWKDVADRLFVWDYDITFTPDTCGYPFPNELYYADKYRFYRDHGVQGIFWEQESTGDDLHDLKFYLKSKLFEDPDCDYDELMTRSFREYFGERAGDAILASRKRLAEAQRRNGGRLGWFPSFRDFDFIKPEDVEFVRRSFELAEKATDGDEKLARRVAAARGGFDRFCNRRHSGGWGRTHDGSLWSKWSPWFGNAPVLEFKSIIGADRYRFDVTDDIHRRRRMDNDIPEISLDAMWESLPTGYVTVDAVGLRGDGSVVGEAGSRTFWKKSEYRSGTYPLRAMTYADARLRIMHRFLALLRDGPLQRIGDADSSCRRETGRLVAAIENSAAAYDDFRSRSKNSLVLVDLLNFSKKAADLLIEEPFPRGTFLECRPATDRNDARERHPFHNHETNAAFAYLPRAAVACLRLYRASSDAKYLEVAKKMADAFAQTQGGEALHRNTANGGVFGNSGLLPFDVVQMYEELYAATDEKTYRESADRVFGLVEEFMESGWLWEVQQESVASTNRQYTNLSCMPANQMVLYVLSRFPGDLNRIAQSEALMKFVEDQFIHWDVPYGNRPPAGVDKDGGICGWWCRTHREAPSPCVVGQYRCAEPDAAAAASCIHAFLAVYKATGKPTYLEKAKVIADALTRMIAEDGCIGTLSNDNDGAAKIMTALDLVDKTETGG